MEEDSCNMFPRYIITKELLLLLSLLLKNILKKKKGRI